MVPQWWFGSPHWRPSVGRRSQWRSTVSSSCNQSAIKGRLEEKDDDNKEEDDDNEEEDNNNEEKDGSAQEESLVDSELAYQVCSVTFKNVAQVREYSMTLGPAPRLSTQLGLGVWQDHGALLGKAPASQGGSNEASIEPGRVAHPQISGEFVVINLAELEREGIGGTCALVKAGEGGPSYDAIAQR
jgi:hypothetical protein